MFKLQQWVFFWVKVVSIPLLLMLSAVGLAVLGQGWQPGREITNNLIIALVAHLVTIMGLAYGVWYSAGSFVKTLYKMDSVGEGMWFIITSRFGRPRFADPFNLVEGCEVSITTNNGLNKTGGPAALVIHDDTAVVLAKAGRLTRVVNKFTELTPFETVYQMIDRRPKRRIYTVSAMSKKGIDIKIDVEVQYQIDDGGQLSTQNNPYPFNETAVVKAATRGWRREQGRGQDMDWEGWIVVSQTEGELRSILARKRLDELIRVNELAAREEIQQQLADALHRVSPKVGAKILEVKLDNLQVHDTVIQRRMEDVAEHWREIAEVKRFKTEAQAIRDTGHKRVGAEYALLRKLSDALQTLDNDEEIDTVLMMQILDTLREAPFDGNTMTFWPTELLKMFQEMQHPARREGERPAERSSAGHSERSEDVVDASLVPYQDDLTRSPLYAPYMGGVAAGSRGDYALPFAANQPPRGMVEIHRHGPMLREGNRQQALDMYGLLNQSVTLDRKHNYFVLKVNGDSMDEAGIADGDYILLAKPQDGHKQPRSGDIVAAVFKPDMAAILKQIEFGQASNKVLLKPISRNPSHTVEAVPVDDFRRSNLKVEIAEIAVAVLKPKTFMVQ